MQGVLHHYKLTRFSNPTYSVDTRSWKFYTITNLQGSQTLLQQIKILLLFYTITNLQGSQTARKRTKRLLPFYTITNLQGSQTVNHFSISLHSFYTITNLQGSQTSNEIITEPNILVNMCKLPSNV